MYNQSIFVPRFGGGAGPPGPSTFAHRFAAPGYTSLARLGGKTPEVDFDVFSADGTGGILNLNDGYTFDSVTGAITVPVGSGNYTVLIYT